MPFIPLSKSLEWSKEEINFLDFNIRLRNKQLETDLHTKTAVISFLTQYENF